MSRTAMRKTKGFLLGIVCSLMAGMPAYADDTEIFFGGTNANSGVKPNLLFILDTSGSMTSKDGGTTTRLDRMKDALKSILTSVNNVNVGLMRFSSPGGPVLYPVSFIDEDACKIENCATPTIQVSIASSADDAEENSTGVVDLTSKDLELMEDKQYAYAPGSEQTIEVSINKSENDVEEYASGSIGKYSSDLEVLYDWVADQTVGLRFENLNIPAGAIITNAELEMQVDETGYGKVSVEIYVEDNDSPAAFSYSTNDVSNRPVVSGLKVNWDELPNKDVGYKVRSPNLKDLIQNLVNRGSWSASSKTAVLIIKKKAGTVIDVNNRRVFESYDGSYAPKLRITYISGATSGNSAQQTVGLRFQNVKIPQGAVITGAYLEFESDQTNSEATNVTVVAQKVVDAPAFTSTNNDITNRLTTVTTAVTTTMAPWTLPDTRYQTADIKAVVQEVVNQSGWCGGNSIVFIATGTGIRNAKSYDGSSAGAPILKVTYDTSGLTAGQGCIAQTLTTQVSQGSDDGEERATNGSMNLSSSDLELVKDGINDQIIGLRFRGLKIPQGATVQSASLQFEIDETPSSQNITLNIYGQAHDDAPPFTVSSGDISGRTKTSASVTWAITVTPGVNQKLDSPDITAIIQEIVNRPGWASGNDLVIIIERQSGGGKRVVESYDGEPSAAAKLTINAKWNAGDTTQGPLVTVRSRLIETVDAMQYKGSTPIVGALYEAALYFQGLPVDHGTHRGTPGHSRREYTRVSHPGTYTGGTVVRDPGCTDEDLNNVACRTEVINGNPVYKSPITASCQQNYIILLSDGSPTYNQSEAKIKAMTGITSCADSWSAACGPEFTKWMFENDLSTTLPDKQNIVTYTIGFNFTGSWLQKLATDGGGQYYTASSAADLTNVFNNIIASILKVDTTFVSPGAAVNQFNRLTHRDEIYFSLFKPDDQPYWAGNLKRYKVDGSPAIVQDANSVAAVDPVTGFFKDAAKSFWSSIVDGNDVKLGGFASMLSLSSRKVYTYTGSSNNLTDASNKLDENNSAITLAMLGISSQTSAYRDSLLKWARGVDIKDYDNDGDTTEIRKQIGDPLHSRPIVVTYGGTDASPDTTIYVATNEGFLYAVDGETGQEQFAFIPQELLPNLDTFYQNTTSATRPYGLDGAITTYVKDVDGDNQIEPLDGDKVYVFVGMRRGGRNYYALDVTDRNNPKLLWTIKGGVTSGFAELGQTWSAATVTKVQIGNTAAKDVLIFAGGYDPDQDAYVTRTADTQGRAIYMVDLQTGSLLWSGGLSGAGHDEVFSSMIYSIPSDIRVLDVNGDGLADQMWVGDMGGQIWRFDIANGQNANSLVTGGVVADFSGTTAADNRRFYYSPDVSLIKKNNALVLNIAIGSGWRAHPLDTVVQDRFYSFTSTDVYSAPSSYTTITESNLHDATANLIGQGTSSEQSSAQADLASKSGWFIKLEGTGEKALSQSVTINNQILFTTYLPTGSVSGCQAAQGAGRSYLVNIADATPVLNLDTLGSNTSLTKTDRYVSLSRGGIPPTPTPFFPDNGSSPIVLIGPEKGPLVNFGELTGRTYWYEKSY